MRYIVSVKGGEKAMKLLQTENKLSCIVTKDSNKTTIKQELEKLFSVKVDKVNIINSQDGQKIAIVKLNKESNAMDVATKLGII